MNACWRFLFLALSLTMVVLAVWASLHSDMFNLSPAVLNEPWFKVTLVDFYFNIAIIAAWMIYKENDWFKRSLWLVAFICLGSIATCFYVFLQLSGLVKGKSIEDVLCRRG